MEEFWNVIAIWITGIITGLVLHSSLVHTYRKILEKIFPYKGKSE